MADYIAYARSNYFAVKDTEKFKEFCDLWGVELITRVDEKGNVLYGFLCDEYIPSYRYDDKTGEEFDNFDADLAAQLQEGWVAIVQELGHEKLRYLGGYSFAINSKGEVLTLSIQDIYEKAKSLGEQITECTY